MLVIFKNKVDMRLSNKYNTNVDFINKKTNAEMSEWSIVQSWNGCVQQCTQGSNPCLCANKRTLLCSFLFAEIEAY